MSSLVISATVVTADPNQAAHAAEVLARAAAGLVLDGIAVNVHLGTVDDDEEDEP